MDETHRDRDAEGRARNARPRDGLGRPLPYGTEGVERQPEGVVRSPEETLREAQRLLDAGMPFHAHEVFEDAWKSGPEEDRELWRAMAQLAVGLTHSARGNTVGGARLLRRGASVLAGYRTREPYGIGVGGLIDWARELAGRVESPDTAGGGSGTPAAASSAGGGRPAAGLDAAAEAPRLRP
ncbi:DUF309 domain-containing protein [Streptomyces sp. NBC_00102]|uniref:DUF309 domain-containing protein n=1 Tax=Streptomyces sp. NBC_00102 TaxID=2975652 RepID=UPI00224F91D1|nr:DUF309 domain-containing protein [Streptomyces sp. NBC_00102]MCX5401177.1 DUF309 domain-containing protein [Streptomyces sp. NBC_00102]